MAKKAESTLVNMLLSLTVIAVVAGVALAFVNGLTEGPIAQVAKQKKADALKEVLPEYARVEVDTLESLPCYIAYDANDNKVGVAVETADENGFNGHIGIMVGFDNEGNVYGYRILETSETPGLGAKANTWFATGNTSIIGKSPSDAGFAVKKDGGQVDAISGSTITSRAFCRAINKAYNATKIGGTAE
ncbi:MAG: RnfABCDGE type electron transport complex subunit G [Bacteroidales bacterium]|nr:RnfABCDGE type electron transport complex subunit G [Bacteroidales bacterium]